MRATKMWIALLAFSLAGGVAKAGDPEVFVDSSNACPGAGTEADPYCSIQGGVDAVDEGGTVHVAAGEYSSVSINKGLTLLGAQAGVCATSRTLPEFFGGAPLTESFIFSGGSGVEITSSNVTVDGFAILSSVFSAGVSIEGSKEDLSNINVLNNIILGGAQIFNASQSLSTAYGIRGNAFGGSLSDLNISCNAISNIGGEFPNDAAAAPYGPNGCTSSVQGIGISLSNVEGAAAGLGASITDNSISNIADGRESFKDCFEIPGVGVRIEPNFGGGPAPAGITPSSGILLTGNSYTDISVGIEIFATSSLINELNALFDGTPLKLFNVSSGPGSPTGLAEVNEPAFGSVHKVVDPSGFPPGVAYYCTGVVFLAPEEECYQEGEPIVILINLRDQGEFIVGGEFFLFYDNTQLLFNDATPGDPDELDPNNPFDRELFQFHDVNGGPPGEGVIEYIVGSPLFGPESDGTMDANTMVRLEFTAISTGACGGVALVRFDRDHVDPPNRITTQEGAKIQPPLEDLPRVIIDGEDPVIDLTASGDKVDDACIGQVDFKAVITDDCCIEAENIRVSVLFDGGSDCEFCMSNADCGEFEPICDSQTMFCRPCQTDGDCAAPTPFCGIDGTCTDVGGPSPLQGSTVSRTDFLRRPSRFEKSSRGAAPSSLQTCDARFRPEYTVTQIDEKTVRVDGFVDVRKLRACPASVQIFVDAVDCCGGEASESTKVEVTDNIKPVIERRSTDELVVKVDPNTCRSNVEICGVLRDNCCTDSAIQNTITIQGLLVSGAATLGPMTKQIGVNPDGSVRFCATIPVSNVSSCPAVVGIRVNGMDCCGNRADEVIFTTEVFDNTPPSTGFLEVFDDKAVEDSITGDCSGTLSFEGCWSDSCCLNQSQVKVSATVVGGCGNAQDPAFSLLQKGPNTVCISGKVNVTDITCCRTDVEVLVNATDCCGNDVVATQVGTIENNVPPTILCPADIEVECFDDVPACAEDLTEFEAQGGTATGGCGTDPLVKCVSTDRDPNSDPPVFVRTYGATSCDSEQARCEQRITVTESTPPVLVSDPPTSPVKLSADVCDSTIRVCGSVTDNCCVEESGLRFTVNATNASYSFAAHDGSCEFTQVAVDRVDFCCDVLVHSLTDCPARAEITISATDCSQIPAAADVVHVVDLLDNTAPTANCPLQGEPCRVECGDPFDPAICGETFGKDNCAGEVTCGFTDDPSTLTGCNGTGTLERTWACTDSCGNSDVESVCIQGIDIVDTVGPVLTGCGDIEVKAPPGACEQTVVLTVTAEDRCLGGPVPVSYRADFGNGFELIAPFAVFPVGCTTVEACASDPCGNRTCCEFDVCVADNQDPVAKCPPDQNVGTDDGLCSAEITFSANANDNCPGASAQCDPSSPVTVSILTGGCMNSAEVCCDATDASGNTDECCFNISVRDDEAPQVFCPLDITKAVDAGTCETIVTENDGFIVSALDNCGDPDLVCRDDFGNIVRAGDTFVVGSHHITCTATDGCDLESVCTFNIVIVDGVPPTPFCPDDIRGIKSDAGNCGAIVGFVATATDNCDPNPIIECDPAPNSKFDTGCTSVTCIARDGVNQASCGFEVCVEDTTWLDISVSAQAINTETNRCVSFTLFDCDSDTAHDFRLQMNFSDTGFATAKVMIPCGDWTSISAKDQFHTLRQTIFLGTDGTRFTADFTGIDTLICGDINDDNIVEVADFGGLLGDLVRSQPLYPGDTDCDDVPPPPFHTDMTGDGFVDQFDFQCLVTNFPRPLDGQCCQIGDELDGLCTPSPNFAGGAQSTRLSMTMSDLSRQVGAETARRLDVDGNGVFDMRDVVDVADTVGLVVSQEVRQAAALQDISGGVNPRSGR